MLTNEFLRFGLGHDDHPSVAHRAEFERSNPDRIDFGGSVAQKVDLEGNRGCQPDTHPTGLGVMRREPTQVEGFLSTQFCTDGNPDVCQSSVVKIVTSSAAIDEFAHRPSLGQMGIFRK